MELKEQGKSNEFHDKKNSESKMPQEDILLRIMGTFGKFQYWQCGWIFFSKILVAFHQIAIVFLAPKIHYTCEDTGVVNGCPCEHPVYNRTEFEQTIQMEWDLICRKSWLSSFSQMIFQFGVLLGSLAFGMMSDRYGRKKPLLLAVVVQIVAGIIAAFMHNFWAFTIVRFFVGLSVGGTMVTGFVLIMEVVGSGKRDVISALYQVPFNCGHILLPVVAYYFRRYDYFQLAISTPAIVMLLYYWTVIESPRWLLANKKTELAIKHLEIVAAKNKRSTENIRHDIEEAQEQLDKNRLKAGSLVDLFRTRNLRRHIIAMSFNWLSCSYCFYGVSQYVGQLSGNVFINVGISAAFALVGSLVSIPILRVMGRKTIVVGGNILCCVCLVILAFVPPGVWAVTMACVGVITSFVLFVVVYLYCSELFPTVVRNAAIGFSSMMARVGSMIAPFVIDLNVVATWLPPIGFALMPFIGIFVSLLLTETKGCELMTTLEEGEAFSKKQSDNNSREGVPDKSIKAVQPTNEAGSQDDTLSAKKSSGRNGNSNLKR